ncbi:hypothetical protein JCM11641_002408 [Rhodosporidiobolus odoratus]
MDSRIPLARFGKAPKRESFAASPFLPPMQERRAPPPPKQLSRRSEQQLPRTTRLSQGSTTSKHPSVGFLPSSSLPYLSSAEGSTRPTPRSSSLPSTSLHHPSNAAALHARRNFSVSTLPSSRPAVALSEGPRPKSFPPLKQRPRLPPRQSHVSNPADDPFKLHASRILRPVASSGDLAAAMITGAPTMQSRNSSASSSSSELDRPTTPVSRRHSSHKRAPSSLRRTATVRSAHRHSRTGSIVRGGTRKRLFAALTTSVDGRASTEMGRDASAGSESVYSQATSMPSPGRRGGGVLVQPKDGDEDDLISQWSAFVGTSSPLTDAAPTQTLRCRGSEPSFPPIRNIHMTAPPSPARSVAESAVSSYSNRYSRDLSTALPRTTTLLDARQNAGDHLPLSPSLQLHTNEISNSMTRVDSEVLITRMALKRLASQGFEGDALDRLGREPVDEDPESGAEQPGPEAWEDDVDEGVAVDDFANQYRDSYNGWTRSTSNSSLESSSSRGSSRSSASRNSSSVGAWKWKPSGGTVSAGLTPSTSASSIGSLKRWSKSTLMDELEREFADLSYELQRTPSAHSTRYFPAEADAEGEWEDDGDYVCALDILLESDEEDVTVDERPASPAPPPPTAPLAPVSRLPRFKSSLSLRDTALSTTNTAVTPPPVPALPSGPSMLPRLAKSRPVAAPPVKAAPAVKSTRPAGGVGGRGVPMRAGWR